MAEGFWAAEVASFAVTVTLFEAVAPRTVAVAWVAGGIAEVQHRGSDPSSSRWRSSWDGCGVCILRSYGREYRSLGRKISCYTVCCGRPDGVRERASEVLWSPIQDVVMRAQEKRVLVGESSPHSWRPLLEVLLLKVQTARAEALVWPACCSYAGWLSPSIAELYLP